jgi:hypothetical protein
MWAVNALRSILMHTGVTRLADAGANPASVAIEARSAVASFED